MKITKMKEFPRQGGVAAVEFALILPVMLLLLAFVVFFGKVFMHYTVAVKAAGDMATFLALARSAEMTDAKQDLGEIGIVTLARSIGEAEFAELNPGKSGKPVISITCDGGTCIGDQIPDEIIVNVKMRMYDPFFSEMINEIGNTNGMWLRAEARARYAGS